ncbi:MAG: AraC family transcriptional regulator [Paramuribaculum sp.]|nr:AraC family transcriptional regulator [Paramuribaculum sp.]
MEKTKAEIVYSEDIHEINSPRFMDWGVHLICNGGDAMFLFNGKPVTIQKNDAAVINHPELVTHINASEDLQIRFIAAPFKFLYNLLPANHYGIIGHISLFTNPVIPLDYEDALRFNNDIEQLRLRSGDRHHLFYDELIGSIALTMIYDLFDFHAKIHRDISPSERTADIVKRLLALLESGRAKRYREVSYYAGELNVSPKYLSETVKRITGNSVMNLIDKYAVPVLIDFLNNSNLSLTQISDEMNFSSLSYFSRYVSKHLGMSPTAYRKING